MKGGVCTTHGVQISHKVLCTNQAKKGGVCVTLMALRGNNAALKDVTTILSREEFVILMVQRLSNVATMDVQPHCKEGRGVSPWPAVDSSPRRTATQDTVIVCTAGRQVVDDVLMEKLRRVERTVYIFGNEQRIVEFLCYERSYSIVVCGMLYLPTNA